MCDRIKVNDRKNAIVVVGMAVYKRAMKVKEVGDCNHAKVVDGMAVDKRAIE